MNNLIIIDTQNHKVTINSDHELKTPEILTELSKGEYAIQTATQDFLMRTGSFIIPTEK
jgi:hypothetical protein